MIPISYLSIFLIVLLLYNKKYASYFYPYILLQSSVGLMKIFVVLLYYYSFNLFNEANQKFLRKIYFYVRNKYDKTFPYNISNYLINYYPSHIVNYFIILALYKIVILYIWPVNISNKALAYSICLIMSFIILNIICLLFK